MECHQENNVFLKTANMIVNQITILQMIMTLRKKKKKKVMLWKENKALDIYIKTFSLKKQLFVKTN